MSTQPLIDPATGKPMKRPASVYTVMLGITVLVLIVCCLLLYFEWKSYDFEIRARLGVATSTQSSLVTACTPPNGLPTIV